MRLNQFGALSALVFLLLSAALIACGGGSNERRESPKLFVVNSHGDSVAVFDVEEVLARFAAGQRDDEGNIAADVAPVRVIGSKTGLALPEGVFVDTVNDEIFVANSADSSIRVYKRTANGDAPPVRVIAGDRTELAGPQGIFVDTIKDEIFVVNFTQTVTVYDRADFGNPAPKRRIFSEGLELTLAISFDAERNELFVTAFDFINGAGRVFILDGRADSGTGLPINIPPKAIIDIAASTVEGFPFLPASVFYNPRNEELFVLSTAIFSNTDSTAVSIPGLEGFPVQRTPDGSIRIYKRAEDGSFNLRQEIRGSRTGLLIPFDISVNTETGEIYAANLFNNSVTVYSRAGDAYQSEPRRVIRAADFNNTSALATRSNLSSIFADADNGEIFLAMLSGKIAVYDEDDSGNASPRRVIGGETGLLEPRWISVDAARGEIFVSNFGGGQITVYQTFGDNSRPVRTISVEPRLLSGGIAFDSSNNLLFAANQLTGNNNNFIDFISAYGAADGVPVGNLSGDNTGLAEAQGVFIDGDELFAANAFGDTVTIYDKSAADGNLPPIAVIREDDFSFPTGVFADSRNIFISNFFAESVSVYDRSDAGARVAVIQEGIRNPTGVFADEEHIFVANSTDNSVAVYGREIPFPLLGVIRGNSAGILFPVGVAVADVP